jgi:hypothetical protein
LDAAAGTTMIVCIVNIMKNPRPKKESGPRQVLWAEAQQRLSAKKLAKIFDYDVAYRGRPAYIRRDNGPEFISGKREQWAQKHQIELKFRQPGNPPSMV